MATRCTATKADSTPCRAWAIPGSEPPLCAAHSGRTGGPPRGNQNARTHGGYAQPAAPGTSLDEELEILTRQIRDVDQFIAQRRATLEPDEFRALHALLGGLISRKGRLMRDRKAVSGEDTDELSRMFEKAAQLLASEKGWNE